VATITDHRLSCTAAAPEGVDTLISAILDRVRMPPPEPVPPLPLLFAVDHCFSVRGQGTVLTGTVLRGIVAVGASVEVPALRMVKKVKSIQVFHHPVTSAAKGDRAGVCLAQMDAKLLERGLLCDPGSVPTFQVAVAAVQRIRYFKGPLPSKAKLHVSVGHATVMAELTFMRGPLAVATKGGRAPGAQASPVDALAHQLGALSVSQRAAQLDVTRGDVEFEYMDELVDPAADAPASDGGLAAQQAQELPMWAVLTFDAPAVAPRESMFIGSRLDLDTAHAAGSTCRLALHGHLAAVFESGDRLPSSVRVFKRKRREGTVERWVDDRTAVCRGMFKRETDISLFEGMAVTTAAGHAGVIVGAFGKSGKYKVSFSASVPAELRDDLGCDAQKLVLEFKRYIGQAEGQAKRMTQ
jgi:selenocysteine-specific elongation factor